MATPGGRKNPTVAEQILEEGYRFDFFQAVRVLERISRERARQDPGEKRHAVGQDQDPAREVVRFRALQSLAFPGSTVVEVGEGPAPARRGDVAPMRTEMVVAFMGLTGPEGVLPDHYTRLIIERLREKDHSLRDFFDLFNHRMISLFFRAWEKYRFPTAYERKRLEAAAGEEQFTTCLYSLAGLATGGLRGRLRVDDESFLYYAGLFADSRRPAVSLQRLLSDYFDVPSRIEQFQGRWLDIDPADRSRIASGGPEERSFNRLGDDLVLGDRVWDVRGKFRIRLGPLGYRDYCRFTPAGDALRALADLTRSYVGAELDFETQMVIRAAEIPPCRLGGGPDYRPLLGWTTWLVSEEVKQDFEDAVFTLEAF